MKNKFLKALLIIVLFLISFAETFGQISVDAGITPAKDRWIVRAQTRLMEREKSGTSNYMNGVMLHNMIAYGIQRNITLIVSGMYQFKEMQMGDMNSESNGFKDLSFLTKYSFYRINERHYTFAVAGLAAITIPIGEENFSSEAWGLKSGFFTSYRTGMNSLDLNLTYYYQGLTTDKAIVIPGNQASIDFAYSRRIPLNNSSIMTLALLTEVSYKIISSDSYKDDTLLQNGESILFVSPGLKFTYFSIIAEALIRIPISQTQDSNKMKLTSSSIFGLRYMF